MAFIPPSKQELKKKYNIAEEDFAVLVEKELPAPEALQKEKAFLVRVADYLGVPVFLKRYGLIGAVIAVVFLPGWAVKSFQEAKNIVVTSYEFYQGKATQLSDYFSGQSTYIVVSPPGQSPTFRSRNLYEVPVATTVSGVSATDAKYFPDMG